MDWLDIGFNIAIGGAIVGIGIWAASMFYLEMKKKRLELKKLEEDK